MTFAMAKKFNCLPQADSIAFFAYTRPPAGMRTIAAFDNASSDSPETIIELFPADAGQQPLFFCFSNDEEAAKSGISPKLLVSFGFGKVFAAPCSPVHLDQSTRPDQRSLPWCKP
jgi:hypothetical protein